MTAPLLFWLYLVNLTLLVLHEMDSAYWKEWELFHLPGGPGGFLLLHLPLYLAGFYGLLLVYQGGLAGLIFSLVTGAAGLFAFGIHTCFLRQGHPQFSTPISRLILAALLVVSLLQVIAALLVP